MVKGDDNTLMNKLAIAVNGDGAERASRPETADPTRKKSAPAKSHIHAARPKAPQAKVPETGPMAAMLAKVFGKKDDERTSRRRKAPADRMAQCVLAHAMPASTSAIAYLTSSDRLDPIAALVRHRVLQLAESRLQRDQRHVHVRLRRSSLAGRKRGGAGGNRYGGGAEAH